LPLQLVPHQATFARWDDLAQPFVVGVVVRQMMNRLACSLWLGWTGAVEREVAQRRELGSAV
jgi:hypothetical protein